MASLLLVLIYLCFISLGLPDSLLGSAWPSISENMNVPLSYAGLVSMTISICTIISSLHSDLLTKKFSPGVVTVTSILLTCIALFLFSFATKFYHFVLIAIPFGLGAGGIDAALNNYVALHYKSSHMSFLHCMWGVGALVSPYIMGYALTNIHNFHAGYRFVAIVQAIIFVIVLISLPLWKKENKINEKKEKAKPLKIKEILEIPGSKCMFVAFFCYCALESTCMLWGASFLHLRSGLSSEKAASLASLFFIGMTVGRFINGFLAIKLEDSFLIRLGQIIVIIGIIFLFFASNVTFSIIGFIVLGFGCAPIYPSFIHLTPGLFGKEKSQAIIGIQMASAYVGSCLMPPLFGVLANNISIALLPYFVLFFLVIEIIMHEILIIKTKKVATN